VGDCLELLVRVADAGRDHRAAQRARAAVEDPAARRQVVGEAVVDQVAGTETRGMERALGAPETAARRLQLVDRAGRGEEARRRAGRQTAEGRRFRLQRDQVRLAGHRESRQGRAVGHRRRVDAVQNAREAGRRLLGVGQLALQRGHERRLALLRAACFEIVEVVPGTGHASQRLRRL
jgi:hypothetical protein